MHWTAFLSYVFITTFTPGPNNILALSHGSAYGLKKTVALCSGILTGFFVVLSISGFLGLSLYAHMPTVKPALSFVGAAYILWLAFHLFKADSNSKANANVSKQSPLKLMATGFVLQFLNPKAILYSITTMSVFVLPHYKAPPIIMGISLLLSLIAFASTCSWALFGTIFQAFLSKHGQIVNRFMAFLLVLCALSLFW